MTWFDWIGTLEPTQGALLGTALGSALGLVALLAGALFNAYLNRRRDDRVRQTERKGVLLAIGAELTVVHDTLLRNAEGLRKEDAPKGSHFTTPDLARHLVVYPALVSKFHLLDQATIERTIEAYGLIGEYVELIALAGGKLDDSIGKRYVTVASEHREYVAKYNTEIANETIGKAIAAIARELKGIRV